MAEAVLVGRGGQPEQYANARLIAAAPMLLEAAKEAKQFLINDLEEPGRTVFWHLADAISAATSQPGEG